MNNSFFRARFCCTFDSYTIKKEMGFLNIKKDQSQKAAIFVCGLVAWLFKQFFSPQFCTKVKKTPSQMRPCTACQVSTHSEFFCRYKPLKVGVSNGNADITLTIPTLPYCSGYQEYFCCQLHLTSLNAHNLFQLSFLGVGLLCAHFPMWLALKERKKPSYSYVNSYIHWYSFITAKKL